MAIDPDTPGLRSAAEDFEAAIHEEALRLDPDDLESLAVLAHHYTRRGRIAEGLALDERLVVLLPDDPVARYNLACSLVLAGREEDALAALAEAVRLGWQDAGHARTDPDLAALRGEPRFEALIEGLEDA